MRSDYATWLNFVITCSWYESWNNRWYRGVAWLIVRTPQFCSQSIFLKIRHTTIFRYSHDSTSVIIAPPSHRVLRLLLWNRIKRLYEVYITRWLYVEIYAARGIICCLYLLTVYPSLHWHSTINYCKISHLTLRALGQDAEASLHGSLVATRLLSYMVTIKALLTWWKIQ